MKMCKEKAAISQLCDAIELFRLKRYISSITLSAASEEVLAQLLKQYSNKISIPLSTAEENETFMFDTFKDFLGVGNYHAYRSKIKNELKHHGEVINKCHLSGNFKQIALHHISGAIINYKTIYNRLPNERLIQQFCIEVGIS